MGPGLRLSDSRIPREDGVVFLEGENMPGGGDERPLLGAVDGLVVDLRREATSSIGGDGVRLLVIVKIGGLSARGVPIGDVYCGSDAVRSMISGEDVTFSETSCKGEGVRCGTEGGWDEWETVELDVGASRCTSWERGKDSGPRGAKDGNDCMADIMAAWLELIGSLREEFGDSNCLACCCASAGSAAPAGDKRKLETTDGIAGDSAGTGVTSGVTFTLVNDPARCVNATTSSFFEVSMSLGRVNDGEDLFAGCWVRELSCFPGFPPSPPLLLAPLPFSSSSNRYG